MPEVIHRVRCIAEGGEVYIPISPFRRGLWVGTESLILTIPEVKGLIQELQRMVEVEEKDNA